MRFIVMMILLSLMYVNKKVALLDKMHISPYELNNKFIRTKPKWAKNNLINKKRNLEGIYVENFDYIYQEEEN